MQQQSLKDDQATDSATSGRSSSQLPRLLMGAASVVVIMWGVRQASQLLTTFLIALLLAYCVLPLPRWIMRRFHIRKGPALAITVTLVGIAYIVISLMLAETGVHLRAKLPGYEEHFKALFDRVTTFLSARGINLDSLTTSTKPNAQRIVGMARTVLPSVIGIFANRLLISLLSLLFLAEMTEHDESKRGPLARSLAYYGGDVQGFIVVMAQTGAITALANLVLLIAIGVDFPVLWCVLYFFLHFIPDVGIAISIVPPALLALITLGWKQALLVVAGLILTNSLADYVLKPRLMKKELHLSFLEIMLSLIIWGFLLGPWGGVLAIPLTLALRRFIAKYSAEDEKLPTTVSASTA